jgi:hypothetical protein
MSLQWALPLLGRASPSAVAAVAADKPPVPSAPAVGVGADGALRPNASGGGYFFDTVGGWGGLLISQFVVEMSRYASALASLQDTPFRVVVDASGHCRSVSSLADIFPAAPCAQPDDALLTLPLDLCFKSCAPWSVNVRLSQPA